MCIAALACIGCFLSQCAGAVKAPLRLLPARRGEESVYAMLSTAAAGGRIFKVEFTVNFFSQVRSDE